MVKGSHITLGVTIAFIFTLLMDPARKRRWTRKLLFICITASVAIIIGEGLKYLLGRARSVMLFEEARYGFTFFSSEWALNSTPSGHTIRAFSILTALSLIQRRLSALFISLAILVGISRVLVTAHYPSDVLFSAFIGIFTAFWIYRCVFKAP